MAIYYHTICLRIAFIYIIYAAAADTAQKCNSVKRICTEYESVENDKKRCRRKARAFIRSEKGRFLCCL